MLTSRAAGRPAVISANGEAVRVGEALGSGRPSSVVTIRSDPRPRSNGSAAAAPMWCMASPGIVSTVEARLGGTFHSSCPGVASSHPGADSPHTVI